MDNLTQYIIIMIISGAIAVFLFSSLKKDRLSLTGNLFLLDVIWMIYATLATIFSLINDFLQLGFGLRPIYAISIIAALITAMAFKAFYLKKYFKD